MIHVDPDWWRSLFDEIYLVTDAPFVCNPELTHREVDGVERVLHLRRTDRILDLCGGQGRHSIELARRGYQHLTVLDYADFLLQRGRREAAETGLRVTFCQGDARAMTFPAAIFDVVLLMAQSFGLFAEAEDDRRLLGEAWRVLAPGGQLLLDLVDRSAALRHFRAESWHEATEDIVVCWKRELAGDVVRVREMVLSKASGLLRDRTYAERLYSAEDLHKLLSEVGFVDVNVQHNAFVHQPNADTDYGLATNRMITTATKP
jgi:D-alanine-D-alanine ligase